MANKPITQTPEQVPLRNLALLFLKLGSMSFGGSMLVLIEDAVVHRKRWLEPERYVDAVALAEISPGPVTLKVAAYVGYLLRGIPGLLVTALCFALPSILLVVAGSVAWFRWGRHFSVGKILTFVDPVVVAAFLATTTRLARRSLLRPFHWIIAISAFAAMRLRLSPLLILGVSGLIGLMLARFSSSKEVVHE